MLPIHGRAISGVTSKLQERANYSATVQEIRAEGDSHINPVRRAQANNEAGDVDREIIDPNGRGRRSAEQGTLSYDAIASEVQEEEQARQEQYELQAKTQQEELKHKHPQGMVITAPGVIVPRGGSRRNMAKLFIQVAAAEGIRQSKATAVPPYGKQPEVKVDVTV